MELNDYKSVTPLKKKRKKITAGAALVLCLLSLIVGVFCGKASGGGASDKQVAEKIEELKKSYEERIKELDATYKDTYDKSIADLKNELNDLRKQVPAGEQVDGESEENSPAAKQDKTNPDDKVDKKENSGFNGTPVIIILVVVIAVCIFYLVKIFRRKNDDADDYIDDDEDDDYDDYEDDYDDDYDDDDDDYEDYEDDEDFDDDDDDEE